VVDRAAVPEESSVTVPSRAAPSKKLTVPVGTPDPGASTVVVAVSVTDWPKTEEAMDEETEVVVAAALTVWVRAAELLAVKFASPEKTAVIERLPTASDEVEKTAVPEVSSVAEPSRVGPSKKLTEPVGTPDPGASTVVVAVSVIDWPVTTVGSDELTDVVVVAWFTVWTSAGEILGAKLRSPPYTAVIDGVPAESVEIVSVAIPDASTEAVPMDVAPFRKVTVPVRVPAVPEVIVAVRVMAWPKTDELAEAVRAVEVIAGWAVRTRSLPEDPA
jgi:hypothetical protein